MSKNYTQLSLEQRYQIETLLGVGIKQKYIAEQLGIHPSTICRELKRNIAKRGPTSGHYVACNAQRKTDNRHSIKPKQILFSEPMKFKIIRQLKVDKWSPEIISATCRIKSEPCVSHETIYRWIWDCKHTNKQQNKNYKELYRYLKHGKRRRKRGNRKDARGVIPNRISIEARPKIVEKRIRLGDIEIDLMMGKNHKGALLVMTDRATLHTMIKKLHRKLSSSVQNAIIFKLNKVKYPLHTLTFDNDKAFSGHKLIAEAMNAQTYFTRPYTSQDKGTVENRIGIIRRFFTKKTDLTLVSAKEVRDVEKKLNNRPIRKFNYLTANQVLKEKIALIS